MPSAESERKVPSDSSVELQRFQNVDFSGWMLYEEIFSRLASEHPTFGTWDGPDDKPKDVTKREWQEINQRALKVLKERGKQAPQTSMSETAHFIDSETIVTKQTPPVTNDVRQLKNRLQSLQKELENLAQCRVADRIAWQNRLRSQARWTWFVVGICSLVAVVALVLVLTRKQEMPVEPILEPATSDKQVTVETKESVTQDTPIDSFTACQFDVPAYETVFISSVGSDQFHTPVGFGDCMFTLRWRKAGEDVWHQLGAYTFETLPDKIEPSEDHRVFDLDVIGRLGGTKGIEQLLPIDLRMNPTYCLNSTEIDQFTSQRDHRTTWIFENGNPMHPIGFAISFEIGDLGKRWRPHSVDLSAGSTMTLHFSDSNICPPCVVLEADPRDGWDVWRIVVEIEPGQSEPIQIEPTESRRKIFVVPAKTHDDVEVNSLAAAMTYTVPGNPGPIQDFMLSDPSSIDGWVIRQTDGEGTETTLVIKALISENQ